MALDLVTEIIDSGASLELLITGSDPKFIQKSNINNISSDLGNVAIRVNKGKGYIFAQSAVTNPASTGEADLAAKIEAFLDTGAPLAAGAATEAKQDAGNTSLDSIDTKVTGLNLEVTQEAIALDVSSLEGKDFATQTTLLAILAKTTGTLTDGSGTTSGTPSTTTEIFAANASRKYLLIQNISDTTIYVNLGADATVDNDSIKLLSNGSFIMEGNAVSIQTVNVISAGTSKEFVAKQA